MLVSDVKRPNIQKLQKRANLPKYFRIGAITALCVTVLAIGIGFYLARNGQRYTRCQFSQAGNRYFPEKRYDAPLEQALRLSA